MAIGQTPATDSKSVTNRVTEVPVPELTGDQAKYYMRVSLKAKAPKGNEVSTRFHSFFCVNEYVMRMGRKGLGKVIVFEDVVTKDNWQLQISINIILNRRGSTEIKRDIRKFASDFIKSKAKELNHDEFVKAVIAGVFQMRIKKGASKIYPVRYNEIIKIETLKTGA